MPCEDVYDDPGDWLLPVRIASVSGGPLPVQSAVVGERLFCGDAICFGSDGRLHPASDGDVPFAVMGAPCMEGDSVILEWVDSTPGPPLTLETLRSAVAERETADRVRAIPVFPIEQRDDGVTAELVSLARAGNEALFREVAGCVMPAAEVTNCWAGTRARLGLPA